MPITLPGIFCSQRTGSQGTEGLGTGRARWQDPLCVIHIWMTQHPESTERRRGDTDKAVLGPGAGPGLLITSTLSFQSGQLPANWLYIPTKREKKLSL